MDKLYKLPEESIKLLHKHGLLKQLIKAEVTSQLLSKISINKELQEKIIQDFLTKRGLNNQAKYEQWLTDNHYKKEEIEYMATAEVRFKQYSIDTFNHKAGTRFLERKNQLDVVVYSLLRLSDYDLAKELFLRIKEGEADLGDLASQYSEGLEKQTRGVIGPAPLDNAHPTLAEVLRTIPSGQVQPPKKILGSFVVLRLESYEPVQLDEFMKTKMSEELSHISINEKVEKLSKELLNQLNDSIENGGI
tara:strand:- start:158 stop:901 length:744 start_codon:yes stop_codon:yes gene_type:complete